MNQVTFKAGYGDPNRTIEKKYNDYAKIDDIIAKYRNRNLQLEQAISDLEMQQRSLIELHNNLLDTDRKEIEEKILKITFNIDSMKKNIENNNEIIRSLWYGFHERM